MAVQDAVPRFELCRRFPQRRFQGYNLARGGGGKTRVCEARMLGGSGDSSNGVTGESD